MKVMHDKYFTPPALAEIIVAYARERKVTVVADFSAGHGELLQAATKRWPRSLAIAVDIDRSCVKTMKAAAPNWIVSKCDFLNEKHRLRNKSIESVRGKVCLVLLNPPFSGRGCASNVVQCGEKLLRCSRAMAFVITSLTYLRKGGALFAILPASCITSEKDRAAREHIESMFGLTVLQNCNRKTFSGCAASTVVVAICARELGQNTSTKSVRRAVGGHRHPIHASLVRGCLPVHRAENGLAGPGWPFVHSTDLLGDRIQSGVRTIRELRRSVVGPCVLIVRVGVPLPDKCVLYLRRQHLVLSDCVIAIKCKDSATAVEVRRRLIRDWTILATAYGGTCAPYVTMLSLRAALSRYGVVIS